MYRSLGNACIALACALAFAVTGGAADLDTAWAALHRLDIAAAKQQFQEVLTADPKNESAKRGLLITAHLDMDHDLASKTVLSMSPSAPDDAYLVPVFEMVTGMMDGWATLPTMQRHLMQLLQKSSSPELRYIGENVSFSMARAATSDYKQKHFSAPTFAPGCWALGPFDNHSNIAFYRAVELERDPLDTAATTIGRHGIRTAWQWLDTDLFNDLNPNDAFEDIAEAAYQFRFFFELPQEMDVLLLPSGLYSSRVYVDGTQIDNDPTYRNANIRKGFRIHLAKGAHELLMVAGGGDLVSLRLTIRDTLYAPIKTLKWLRYASVAPNPVVTATPVHPIFDSFDALSAARGTESDLCYWKAVLRTYNGYIPEALLELEDLRGQDSLSLMERWILSHVYNVNKEEMQETELLGAIKDSAQAATIEMNWLNKSISNNQEKATAMVVLADKYPGRYELETWRVVKEMGQSNIQTYMLGMQKLLVRFPDAAALHMIMSMLYKEVLRDNDAALRELQAYCDKMQRKSQYNVLVWDIYEAMQKQDEMIKTAERTLVHSPYSNRFLQNLLRSYTAAHKTAAAIPRLTAAAARYPYSLEIYDALTEAYNQTGEYEKSKEALRAIHRIKPLAPSPYIRLSELRNEASMDSIFGTLDVEKYWDVMPTEVELGGQHYWQIVDRIQRLVIDAGPICRDVHFATVCLDREAVQGYQEFELPIDPSMSFTSALVARRLRKGQPPLPADMRGSTLLFKDLRPGDAIEIRYRLWESNRGDLWKDFWNTYYAFSGYYQRYWEYTILTNRNDITYKTVAPAPEPEIDQHCGYRRMVWHGEKAASVPLSLDMVPPSGDILGRVHVSTIADWDALNKWYYSVSEAVLAENPHTVELAHTLTEGLTTEREKMAALYDFANLEIPYQVIRFDYEGSIPQKPDEVLVRRWGDCKDKAHLLIKMLREVGMKAWPVLVLSRGEYTDMPLPSFSFDHLIVGSIVDGDTVFIDVTATGFPFDQTITDFTASQPMMSIAPDGPGVLAKLPALDPAASTGHDTLEVWLGPDGRGDYSYGFRAEQQTAGQRRYTLSQYSQTDLKQGLESSCSESWKAPLTIDSLSYDSTNTTDPTFREHWYGAIKIDLQAVGQMSILKPPQWSPYDEGIFARLAYQGKRDFPIDLTEYSSVTTNTLIFHVPKELGEPTKALPVSISDSLWNFSYAVDWDKAKRTLTLKYKTTIRPGRCDLAEFSTFAKSVMDTYSKPVVFNAVQ